MAEYVPKAGIATGAIARTLHTLVRHVPKVSDSEALQRQLILIVLFIVDAATVGFNGEQYVTIILPEELQTQSESVHLRFRTTKPNGLLLTTSHGVLNHHLTMLLDSGSVRLDMNYGEGHQEHLIVLGSNLNDDKWHTIHMERRGPSLEVTFDKGPKKMIELTGQHFTLHIGAIHLGARLNLHKASRKLHTDT